MIWQFRLAACCSRRTRGSQAANNSLLQDLYFAEIDHQRCARTDDFRVDPSPKGGCTLLLTNGDGGGNDEVQND